MFKKAFLIQKNNTIYIEPLLLWQIVLAIALLVNAHRVQIPIARFSVWASVILLFIACLSGTLYINKLAVLSYKEDDSEEEIAVKSFENLTKFFEGVGSDFFRIFLSSVLIVFSYAVSFYFIYKYCTQYFGVPDFINHIMQISHSEPKEQFLQFLKTITIDDKLIFFKWLLIFNIGLTILNFFSILYLTVMSFERSNFLLSFCKAIKFFIVNIFEEIGIMIFFFLLYFLINMLSLFAGNNYILFTILVIILTFYFNYYILLVFCFYEEKTKNNSNNRSEFNRENETGDRIS